MKVLSFAIVFYFILMVAAAHARGRELSDMLFGASYQQQSVGPEGGVSQQVGSPGGVSRKPQDANQLHILDLNSASKDALRLLPGLNDADVDRIIAKRPYKRKEDLKSRKVIRPQAYEDIKDRITAISGK